MSGFFRIESHVLGLSVKAGLMVLLNEQDPIVVLGDDSGVGAGPDLTRVGLHAGNLGLYRYCYKIMT